MIDKIGAIKFCEQQKKRKAFFFFLVELRKCVIQFCRDTYTNSPQAFISSTVILSGPSDLLPFMCCIASSDSAFSIDGPSHWLWAFV